MDIVNKYHMMHIEGQHSLRLEEINGGYDLVPRIKCKDGFSMSAQGGRYAYSIPRKDYKPLIPMSENTYTHFEVGFPSEEVPDFMPYCESPERPTDTVYARVPVEVIVKVINDHGGISE